MGNKKYMPKEPNELDKTKQELEKVQAQLEEYTDTLKRLQAEFENYMKRVERERDTMVKCASETVLKKLLSVVDDMDRALQTMKGEEDKEGMAMIYSNLKKLLEEEGIRPIKAVGEKFDPYKHEVILKVESEEPEDIVVEELQKGYMLKDKVIRTSKVKISGGK